MVDLGNFFDCDDALWLFAIRKINIPKYDVVLADEAQDFTKC